MAALPPPRSGLPLEISFRRLLRSCEEIAAGDCKNRPDLQDFPTSPVYHTNVEYLQEQLADLSSIPNSRIEPRLLEAYRDRVSILAQKMKPISLPSYCAMPPPEYDGHRSTAASSEAALPSQALKASNQLNGGMSQSELRQRHNPQPARPDAVKRGGGPLHKSTQDRLDRQEVLQDSLTDDMVALAAGLKRNAQAMRQAVGRRDGLLDETENLVDDSLVKAKRSTKESKSLKIKGTFTFCMILLAISLVSMVFIGTYIFIKTTSFVGYKSRPRL